MATRRTGPRQPNENAPQLRPDTQNPFQHIPFNETDLSGIYVGGGGPKEFVPVDAAYREALVTALDTSSAQLAEELEIYPLALGPLVLRLRQEGIAKSHRPTALVEESGLIPAGHEKIEEMLVGAYTGTLALLRNVILQRDIKSIRANLSVIERIEPWGRARRNPEGTLAIRESGSALMRIFRYRNDAANVNAFEGIRHLLTRLGLRHKFIRPSRNWYYISLQNLEDIAEEKFDELLRFPGLRRLMPEPVAHALATLPQTRAPNGQPTMPPPPPNVDLPVVGVFDTGVSPAAADLTPWLIGSYPFVLPPETNYEHGTSVSSLVAGAHQLNQQHDDLPQIGALVFDVCGLESVPGGGRISDLSLRLEEALKQRPDIRIWNLSLGAPAPCDEQTFSEFGQTLDRLSDQYNVLFVVAAGNYVDTPRRSWPSTSALRDRISSPADSVRSLTVGSVCHLSGPNALNSVGEPAAYSRRGPGPVFTPKPDIVHAGGGVHAPWSTGNSSIAVLTASNNVGYGFGTSYAAPIASSMAAHAWKAIDHQQGLRGSPALVKAMLIHAAQLTSPAYDPLERRYFGTGLPRDVVASLYDRADSFTLMFEAKLVPGMRWRKSPYPIPSGLVSNGKLAAEVILTAVYAPPLDPEAGAEYVRANVELSFGTLDGDNIKSKVPMMGEDGTSGYESMQIEHGGKWAPVKVHRKVFPQGVGGGDWALQARMFLRAFEPAMAEGLSVFILCTLRALDGNPNIHNQGLQALAATNWVRQDLPAHVPVQVGLSS